MRFIDTRALVDDRPHEGVFRVHRDVFADAALFELEMENVFGKTWVFLGTESQVAKPNDFISTWIGRTPILVTRDKAGSLSAFLNICPHKGTQLVHAEQGNSKYHVCAYHGWAFDPAGRNIDIKDRAAACYPPAFEAQNHDLVPIARVASYGGLIFGSLSPDVPALDDYLGDVKAFIDMAMQQGPHGMEVVRGRVCYTYRGNWKLQMDNAMDQYHLTSVHASYMGVMDKRRKGDGHTDAHQFDWNKRVLQQSGMFNFSHGHSVTWINQAEVEKRPIYPVMDEIRSRVGAVKADWMLKAKITLIFPNFQIADGTTLNLRTFRPISVGLTEMRVHCIAPIGEDPALRTWRLRQFEDFFGASGFASPDDAACFEAAQRGYAAMPYDWLQGYSRGITRLKVGADEHAAQIGIRPVASLAGDFDLNCETTLHSPYREWVRLMGGGSSGEKGLKP